jgi:hypothetical protein
MVSSKEPGRKRPEAQSAAPSTSSSGSVSANGSASMKTNPEWSTDAKKRSFNMFNAAYIYLYEYMIVQRKIKHNVHHCARNNVPVGIGQESINTGTFLSGLLPIVLSHIRWKGVVRQS